MDEERRVKLLKYLFPTEKIRKFMCNDLYVELSLIIPDNICISRKNIKNETRKENLSTVKSIIKNFLLKHEFYKTEISKIYNLTELDQIVDLTTICFVFIALHEGGIKCYDIFLDKTSICHSPISVIDFL